MKNKKPKITQLFNQYISWVQLTTVISTIVLILTILAFFNHLHLFLELTSHFRLQYLIASIVCSLIFLFYRSPKLFSVMLVVTIVNAMYILPWYFPNSNQVNDDRSVELKVLLSNVNTNNTNYQKVIDLVLQESPDLFFVQEVAGILLKVGAEPMVVFE